MVCGIDTYHEAARKSNSVAGFVSSVNETCTRWYSRVCGQNPHEELINGLKPCFTAAIRKYHEVGVVVPLVFQQFNWSTKVCHLALCSVITI
jgi:aubergine-like protein